MRWTVDTTTQPPSPAESYMAEALGTHVVSPPRLFLLHQALSSFPFVLLYQADPHTYPPTGTGPEACKWRYDLSDRSSRLWSAKNISSDPAIKIAASLAL